MKATHVVIGHRGVGKTSFGHRLDHYFRGSANIIDLDQEIETLHGPISKVFETHGESEFRSLEKGTFRKIWEQRDPNQINWIIVGAGFPVELIPVEAKVVFLSRPSDLLGRIFLDRPSLLPSISPLEEFYEKYQQRHGKFIAAADIYYEMPEGLGLFRDQDEIEKNFLTRSFKTRFGYTLHREDIEKKSRMLDLIEMVQNGCIRFLELRDDLIEFNSIVNVISLVGSESVLLSFRQVSSVHHCQIFAKMGKKFWGIDWDLHLGTFPPEFPQANCKIISHHGAKFDFPEDLDKSWTLKWSPLVQTWDEMKEALDVIKSVQTPISFLPRSVDGRWKWLRLLRSPKQEINFLRLGQASAADQPSLYQAIQVYDFNQPEILEFAAVLGDPIEHSMSPLYHQDFFSKFDLPYFAVSVQHSEWICALETLAGLGLKFASVTSPLKESAFGSSKAADQLTIKLNSVNTLSRNGNEWIGHNTDFEGISRGLFKPFFEKFPVDDSINILVWGGGGTRAMIGLALNEIGIKNVFFISARAPDLNSVNLQNPCVVIWASATSPETKIPGIDVKVIHVLDLNYTESTLGRELARLRRVPYISGVDFFKFQALAQQKIWSEK